VVPSEGASPADAGSQPIPKLWRDKNFSSGTFAFLRIVYSGPETDSFWIDAKRQKLPLDVQQFPSALDFGLPLNRHEPKNQKCLSNRYDRTEEWIVSFCCAVAMMFP
jgi:hypothetical protein